MWKMIPTPNGFWKPESKTDTSIPLPSGMTLTPLTENPGEAELTWYMVDSLARTSAPQDEGPDLMALAAASGGKCLDAFGKWDQNTSSLRTLQESLLEDQPEPWSESWPASGTMQNGTCYRLPQLAPRTSVGGGGVLPTPRVRGLLGGSGSREMMQNMVERGQIKQNEAEAMLGVKFEDSWNGANSLGQMAKQGKWPTPVADGDRTTNYKQGGTSLGYAARNLIESTGYHSNIEEAVAQSTDAQGQLNPDFVSWLMGVPQGWVSLEPLPPEHWERWQTEPHWANGEWPNVPRVATGVKDRVNQLKMLGNGIVPDCPAMFIRLLAQTSAKKRNDIDA